MGHALRADIARPGAAVSELGDEIAARRRQIGLLVEAIADHQALVQRLQSERSVLEAEIRGIEDAARLAHIRITKPANDD